VFLDLLFLVEYMSVLYENDDKHKRGDR
jgi:hypothetical protein